jgi:hypothetical protein
LPVQYAVGSAVVTITRTITVAAGVFAPGHLGELTRIVPFEMADAVLEETRTRERRLRVLPSRVGLYFVLALGLFPQAGYLGVRAELTAALDGLGLAVPPEPAIDRQSRTSAPRQHHDHSEHSCRIRKVLSYQRPEQGRWLE